MTISDIRTLCNDRDIEVTLHMLQKMATRNISFSEVKEVIQNGEIIEEYPEDFPYPSCLVLGYSFNSRVLHVVLGIGDSKLWLITAYEPDPELWDHDFSHRKESKTNG